MQLSAALRPRHRPRLGRDGGTLTPAGIVARALGGAALVTVSTTAFASEPGEQEAGYLFRFFSDVDDVRVASHYGHVDVGLTNGLGLDVDWNHERVTIPGVDAPAGSPEALDAITTASRPISGFSSAFTDYVKVRNEVQGDLTFKQASVGYYVSQEEDYFAQLVRAGVDRDLLDRNLNLALGASYAWDRIEPLADDDTSGEVERKRTVHWNAAATQTLTPTTVLRVGGEINHVRGLQHNPYRNVYAGGGPVPERHPDERWRQDVFLNLNQYFANRSSVWLSYRYYWDDWDVRSHAIGAMLHQYVTGDVVARYRYRYYRQDAAGFYRDEYAEAGGIDGYRTGDYRLGELTSNLFGGRLELGLEVFRRRSPVLRRLAFSIDYERYFNSNDFSANVFETGLAYRF